MLLFFTNSSSEKWLGYLKTVHKVKQVLYKRFPENWWLRRGIILCSGNAVSYWEMHHCYFKTSSAKYLCHRVFYM